MPTDDSWKDHLVTFAEYLSRGNWKPYRHLTYLAKEITKAIGPGSGRLIINMPPRHGKSTLASHWFPAWFLEAFPEQWVMLCSYEASIAADWGRRVRDTFNTRELWTNIRDDVRAANRWYTPEGGGMITAGVGGPIGGRGFHLGIIDDPFKNWEQAYSSTYRRHLLDWFQSTFYTRKEPNGSIVIIQTRWHENDLAGWLIKEHSDKWTEINLPALAEENDPIGREQGEPLCSERYGKDELDRIREAVGSKVWSGLYQQRPAPAGGAIFKQEWIRYWETLPTVELQIQSWDAAFKDAKSSSYVVGQLWGKHGSDFYLLGQKRDRMDFVSTLAAIESMTKFWPEATGKLVEDKANGPAIISTLQNKIPGILPVNPRGSKEARAQAVAPLWESGHVYLPHPNIHTWVRDFVEELITFPASANDDQVDAMSQALSHLSERQHASLDIKIPDLTQGSIWRM